MEMSDQLCTPATLPLQGKNPWYPLDRRLSGPQRLSGCSGNEKKFQLLPGIKPWLSSL